MQFPTFKRENQKILEGYSHVAGCDEVGVAPVAGPVVAAACILDPAGISGYRSKSKWFYRVRDSKTVNEKEREALVQEIKSRTLAYGVGEVWPDVIDQINIHNAILLAMKNAVHQTMERIGEAAQRVFLFLDGRFLIKDLQWPNIQQEAVIDGDALILSISAASIIAKCHRDAILRDADLKMPEYGFAKHKGYNTKAHFDAIKKHGVTDFHRKSFLKEFVQ